MNWFPDTMDKLFSFDTRKTNKTVERPSSSVEDVKYSPGENICKVKFTNGDKYYDYSMTSDEFKRFMESDSKGRYVSRVMHYDNLMPGYVSPRQ